MTKTTGKEVKTVGKKVDFSIYLTDEVRTKLINLDSKNYNIKKTTLILTYCKLVSYRTDKHETVSIDMERVATDVGSTRQYVSNCVDVLIEEGILASVKNGTIGTSSVYGFPLEPNKGYSRMKFNDYRKKEEDIRLVDNLNNLSSGAKALYCIMKGQKDFSILSARTGEKYLGTSYVMVSKYLKELEESGMIFSDGQKRYFPQEFEYEIDNTKVDVSKENNKELKKLEMYLKDAKDKYQELKNKNEELNKEIRRLQNSSEAEELKELKKEIKRLTSELENERRSNKVICKNRTKKELEIYIDQLEERNKELEEERAQTKGFEDAGEYNLFESIKQRCYTLTQKNQELESKLSKLELELSKYKEENEMIYDENTW